MKEFIIEECPECGKGVPVKKGKFVLHEKRLAYMPYGLYKRIERITGSSVKEQAKNNKCKGSYQIFLLNNEETKQ